MAALAVVLAVVWVSSVHAEKYILIQDAGIDDFMCTVLLSHFGEDFIGEVVVNADSVLPYSMEVASKFHSALGLEKTALGLSQARMYNAFPWSYRADTYKLANLSIMQSYPSTVSWPFADGDAWLLGALREHTDVTIVITTAPTPLTSLLTAHPELASSVKRVLWMAGAVSVPGNLDPRQYAAQPWNTRAEWNAFADPEASLALLRVAAQHAIPVLLFPLDISNAAPINPEFYATLEGVVAGSPPEKRKMHQLILDAYLLVRDDYYYRLWDTVATGYLLWPDLYSPPAVMNLTVNTRPPAMGQTLPASGPDAYPVTVFLAFRNTTACRQFIVNVALA